MPSRYRSPDGRRDRPRPILASVLANPQARLQRELHSGMKTLGFPTFRAHRAFIQAQIHGLRTEERPRSADYPKWMEFAEAANPSPLSGNRLTHPRPPQRISPSKTLRTRGQTASTIFEFSRKWRSNTYCHATGGSDECANCGFFEPRSNGTETVPEFLERKLLGRCVDQGL